MPRYIRNFISEAIIRIDFTNSIKELTNVVDEKLDNTILKFYPEKVSKNSFTEELFLNPNSNIVDRNKIEFKEWNYYANEKNKRLCLTRDFIFISYKQYISYEDFTKSFMLILEKLKEIFNDFSCKRFGIRYINNIKLEGDPLDWSEYINDSMTSIFKIKPEDIEFTRVFQVLEYLKDDIKIKFQFGMHNPDYPSTIRQKVFVLDIDSYRIGQIGMEEIEIILPETHKIIEDLFENSIKQPLKDIMNA